MSRYTKSMADALQQVDDRTQEFDEAVKWEVKITGLPTFYSDGKSRGEVKQALRKLLKRPDDIESIERTTPAELKKIRRGQASGSEPDDEDQESEKVKEEVKINRIIKAQNEALNVDDIVNMIQFGHPFKVVEDIPAELPPGPDIPKYKDVSNATVDKEDKKANKVKDKVEKEVLKPTQTEEGKLPPHLAKFLDKKGNPNKEAQARIDAGRKKRAADAAKPKITDVTPKGYGPSDEEVQNEGGQDIQSRQGSHVAGKKGISLDKLSPSTLAAIRKQRAQKRQDGEAKRSWKRPIGQAEEVELDEIGFAQAGKRASANAIARGRAKEKEADDRELALKKKVSITQKGLDALRRDRDRPKVKTQVKITKKGRDAIRDEVEVDEGNVKGKGEWMPYLGQHSGEKERADKQKKREAQAKDKRNQNKDPVGKQHEEMVEKISRKLREVAPPGWGHTKAEKSKTHPEKPKSKIGGSIEAMKKAQERGDIPKDMNIFALAWSMKNKGDKPHYKQGEKDVLKKKYKGPKGQNEESILDSAKRYVIDERADWETAFKSASQSRPAMKYKDAAAFIDTAGLSSTEKRTALKSAKKWLK